MTGSTHDPATGRRAALPEEGPLHVSVPAVPLTVGHPVVPAADAAPSPAAAWTPPPMISQLTVADPDSLPVVSQDRGRPAQLIPAGTREARAPANGDARLGW